MTRNQVKPWQRESEHLATNIVQVRSAWGETFKVSRAVAVHFVDMDEGYVVSGQTVQMYTSL